MKTIAYPFGTPLKGCQKKIWVQTLLYNEGDVFVAELIEEKHHQ